MSWEDFMVAVQPYLPQHTLSNLMHRLARCENEWVKSNLIRFVVDTYQVNLAEAKVRDQASFKSFNHFFTRELAEAVRTFDRGASAVCSPVDGRVSQSGKIEAGTIFQAKGHSYRVAELLGGDPQDYTPFVQGQFANLYLSPKDYHRIHMPVDGTLRKMIYIPGKLFSVSPATVRQVPNLFARNERLVVLFDTELGPMAMVLVGAIFVGSMETVWSGSISKSSPSPRVYEYAGQQPPLLLHKGDEMGRFNMGSTVIVLFARDGLAWETSLKPDAPVVMGERMASIV